MRRRGTSLQRPQRGTDDVTSFLSVPEKKKPLVSFFLFSMFCAFLGRWPRPSHRLSSTWRSMQFVQQVLSFKPYFTLRLWCRRRAATQRCRHHGGAMLRACCLQTCGHRHRSQLLVDVCGFYLHSAALSCITPSSVFLMRSPDCYKCDILFKHSFICRGELGSSTFWPRLYYVLSALSKAAVDFMTPLFPIWPAWILPHRFF